MRFTAYVSSFLFAAAIPALCDTPEQRAIRYLSAEVPKWAGENKCYSCHNNGDGARALYAAICMGYDVAPAALADTTKWLLTPAEWDKGRVDASISDKKLARIQFAASLVLALDAGRIEDRRPLNSAAEGMVRDQAPDGSWQIDGENSVGSPVTYGAALATMMSLKTLERAESSRFASAITKATQWLSVTEPANTLDAAAIFFAIPGRREALFKRIAQAQTARGGPAGTEEQLPLAPARSPQTRSPPPSVSP
jgi:hypothetical protein